MTVHEYPELVQGSDEWLQARCGVVTASVVGNLISKQQPSPDEYGCSECGSAAGAPCVSKARKEPTPISTFHKIRQATAAMQPARLVTANTDTSRGLILSLAAERITGRVEDSYVSFDMQRGRDEEPFARAAYEAARMTRVVELGFMKRDEWGFEIGYSPDGLVADSGLIEIKSRRQKAHVAIVIADQVPEEHMPQIMCGLLVSGRSWLDYVDFSNGMELFTKRVLPDPMWFDAITEAVCSAEESIQRIVTAYNEAAANLPATERIKELEELLNFEETA